MLHSSLRHQVAIVVLACASLLATPTPAAGQKIVSNGEIAGVIAGIVVAGAVIGVGTYYLIHKRASITGCAVGNQNNVELRNDSDQQIYVLSGDLGAIKSGDRVQVKGKKSKDSSAGRSFLVEKLVRNYGPCKA